MEKKSKKQVLIAVTVLLLVTLTLLGITYAYYRTRIIGNENDKSISVTSKVLELTYSDDNAVISANDIEPGDTITKTFSVSNTGDDTISGYGVYLENVVNTFSRTEDWTYTLTCKSVKSGTTTTSGSCTGGEGEFPTEEFLLINNNIAKGITHNYTLTITYANLEDVNQSDDMGKSLSAKLNIRDKDVINPYSDNKDTLAYNIIDYAMTGGISTFRSIPLTKVGDEVSSETMLTTVGEPFEVTTADDLNVDKYYVYSDELEYNKYGKFRLKDPKIGKYSEIYDELNGMYVWDWLGQTSSEISNDWEMFMNYIYNTTATSLIAEQLEVMIDDALSLEGTLSVTEDDYGDSYYYRGYTEDNYVTFNNMCWRIARIQGDGSIKIVLADSEESCSVDLYEKTDSVFIGTADWGYTGSGSSLQADYNVGSTTSIKAKLNTFLEGFSEEAKSKIKNDVWCIGDENTLTRLSAETATSTLKCSGETITSQIGLLTADEVAHAGLRYGGINYGTYLTGNDYGSYWLMSKASSSQAFIVNEPALPLTLTSIAVNNTLQIRPAITLKSGVEITGGYGELSEPYVIE